MKNKVWLALFFAPLALASACGSSKNSAKAGATDAGPMADGPPVGEGGASCTSSVTPPTTADCPVVVSDANCDKNQRPFVFVHGTFGSGDNFERVAQLLTSNGFCSNRIIGVEYNSVAVLLGQTVDTDSLIDAAITKILADPTVVDCSGKAFTQVDLAGHSQGTMHASNYLMTPAHAAKIAHYFNFSGRVPVFGVQTLSVSSMHDLGGMPNHAMGTTCTSGPGEPLMPAGCNVVEVTFQDQDHFACAASKDTFVAVYKYLTGNAPKYTDVQCGDDPVTIEGIGETFADNVPVTGKVEIREVGDTPRAADTPYLTVMPDGTTGHFGPVQIKRNVAYEFKGFDSQGNLVGYLYPTPFKRDNRLLRMLTPSNNSLVKAASTDHIVRGPNHVAIVARWGGGAFRQDLGASLTDDGTEHSGPFEVLTDGNAGASALATSNLAGGVVGFFMYDDNMNMMTDLGLPYSYSFLAFTDVYMQATTPGFINFSFTPGSEDPTAMNVPLKISNWPSSDALVQIMFQ